MARKSALRDGGISACATASPSGRSRLERAAVEDRARDVRGGVFGRSIGSRGGPNRETRWRDLEGSSSRSEMSASPGMNGNSELPARQQEIAAPALAVGEQVEVVGVQLGLSASRRRPRAWRELRHR
jgi:hypothetical protein